MEQSIAQRNVLVAVDIQNDFISGSLPVTEGEEVVRPINEVAQTVRENGGTVTFTRDWHPAETPHFTTWPVHCVAGTEGAAFHPSLEVLENDTVISKGMEQTDGYSGWDGVGENGTTLERIIGPQDRHERVRVFIGGLATDYCVKATSIDIVKQFKDDERVSLFLLRDAIRAVNLQPEDGDEALKAMCDAGAVALTCEDARRLIAEGA